MKTKKLNSAFDYGFAYAEWGHSEKLEGFNGPVDTQANIPDGDAKQMQRAGVELNTREYWKGFNAFFGK